MGILCVEIKPYRYEKRKGDREGELLCSVEVLMIRLGGRNEKHEKKSEVDSANASGTQALTLRGLSNPGVMCMGVVYREAVSRYTVITPP